MARDKLLRLALPEFDPDPANPPESKPVAVEAWLEKLPFEQPVDVAQAMGDALAALNRIRLPTRTRHDLTELFGLYAARLWSDLETLFVTATHPLSGVPLAATKASIALAAEINNAFKRCLTDEANRKMWIVGSRQLPMLLHRCQVAAARVLSVSYLSFSPVPTGTWHDLHAIYILAKQRQLGAVSVNPDSPGLTPERAYIQTLLLALANPYGFLPGQLGQVLSYIAEHSDAAALSEQPPFHRSAKAVAIVPVGYDFPPFSANKGGAAEGEPLYLLTYDLAFSLQDDIQRAEHGAALPEGAGRITTESSRRRYINLLRRLLRQWGDPPTRQFNRLPSRTELAACNGLNLVWQVTKSLKTESDIPSAAASAFAACRVINQTPGGYALRLAEQNALSLRIGELVGMRVESKSRWQIGIVRWFRNTLRGRGLEFGCEVITENAEPIVAKAEEADDRELIPALYLPDENHGTPSLILPPGRFELEQAVSLRRGRSASTAVLIKLVERSPGFDQFEFVAVP